MGLNTKCPIRGSAHPDYLCPDGKGIVEMKVNMEELRTEIYALAHLKLDEQDAEELTEAIIDAIEENLEEANLPTR